MASPVSAPSWATFRDPRAAWCIWFALLMATPYMDRDLSGYAGAWGPSSLSPLFAWAALGVVVGLWLGSYPRFERLVAATSRASRAMVLVGLIVTAVVIVPECLRGLAEIFGWSLSWMDAPGYPNLYRAWTDLLQRGPLLIFIASVACGWSGWNVTTPTKRAERPRGFAALLALAFVMGLLQPLAWTLLLPHSPFPQPLMGVEGVRPEDAWHAGAAPLWVLTVLVPLLLMGAFALVSTGVSPSRSALAPAAALCLGVLAFRVVGRVMPSLYAVQLWQAVLALVLYACCFGGFAILTVAAQRRPAPTAEKPLESIAPATSEDLLRALTADGIAHLRSRGLTERELLVVAAQLRGLTAAEAGSILGVAEPTVREYRRRCRKKLGLDDLRAVGDVLPAGSLAQPLAGADGAHDGLAASAALACLVVAVVLALLPGEGVPSVWSDVWTVPFGLAFGLACAWSVRLMCAASPKSAAFERFVMPCAAIGLVGAAVALIDLRLGFLLPVAEGATHKAWMLGSTALFVCCAALLLDDSVPHTGTKALVGTAIAACAALLCAQLGDMPWALLFACAVVGTAALVMHARGAARASGGFSPCLCAWRMPWLAAAALVAWTWSEVWRARTYGSLLPAMEWGACAVVALASYRLYRARGVSVRPALVVMLVTGLAVGIVVGLGEALVMYALLLTVMWGQECECTNVGHPWHVGIVAIAGGAAGGTLITNAVGYAFSSHANLMSLGGLPALGALVACGVGLAWLLVIIACVMDVGRMRHRAAGLLDARQVEALLVDRGLSCAQAQMVALLVEGASATEVAAGLHYARSTVERARRDACRAFGVRTCGQLAERLGELAD